LSRVNLRHASRERRCGIMLPRHAIGAKIRVLRRPPESTRTGFGVGAWRMAGPDSRMRPPDLWHVAPVDGVQSAVGMPPKDAVCATRPNRQRGGSDAFAAPLLAVRLRPVRRPLRGGSTAPARGDGTGPHYLSSCAGRRSWRSSVAASGPIKDLPFVQTSVRGRRATYLCWALPLAETRSKSHSRLRPRGPQRHNRKYVKN
jgi:hypothetical protein